MTQGSGMRARFSLIARAFARRFSASSARIVRSSLTGEQFPFSAMARYRSHRVKRFVSRRYFAFEASSSSIVFLLGGVVVAGEVGLVAQCSFLVGLPLGEALVEIHGGQRVEAVLDVHQSDAPDRLQVADAVLQRPLHGPDEECRGHPSGQPEELAQE